MIIGHVHYLGPHVTVSPPSSGAVLREKALTAQWRMKALPWKRTMNESWFISGAQCTKSVRDGPLISDEAALMFDFSFLFYPDFVSVSARRTQISADLHSHGEDDVGPSQVRPNMSTKSPYVNGQRGEAPKLLHSRFLFFPTLFSTREMFTSAISPLGFSAHMFDGNRSSR